MANTKKGFLKAGGILSIITATMAIIVGLFAFSFCNYYLNRDLFIAIYESDPTTYEKVENSDGSIEFRYVDETTGDTVVITEGEIDLAVSAIKSVVRVGVVILIGISIAKMAVAICLMINTFKDKNSMGLTIALLIMSCVTVCFLTVAFMIVALCLKDSPKVDNATNSVDPEIIVE